MPISIRRRFVAFLLAAAAGSMHAQTAASVYPQAWQSFNGSQPIHSISLTANAIYTAGSDNESGTATLIANADGSQNIQLSLSEGTRTETQTSFSTGQQAAWTGVNGVTHNFSFQNSQLPAAWFMPSVALFGGLQPSSIISALGNANTLLMHNTAQGNTDPASAALYAHISSIALSYDPTTNLPTALSFSIHSDKGSQQDIPVLIEYSSYQVIDGVAIPFEIQRYVNGTLALSLTITQASAN